MDWLDFRYYNRYLRSIYKEKWPRGTHSFRGSGARGGKHIDCWSLAERALPGNSRGPWQSQPLPSWLEGKERKGCHPTAPLKIVLQCPDDIPGGGFPHLL